MDYIDGWLNQSCATVVAPTEAHTSLLRKLLQPLGSAGNLTSDAHLAALAIEHGAELYSCDTALRASRGCAGVIRWAEGAWPTLSAYALSPASPFCLTRSLRLHRLRRVLPIWPPNSTETSAPCGRPTPSR